MSDAAESPPLSPARATLAALRRAFQADPVLTLVFPVAVIASVVPFWVGRYLPFLDMPQHLATIAVVHGLGDPSTGYADYFTLEWASTPYLLYYLVSDGLASLIGVDAANRVFLSAYAALLPIALLSFLRAFHRAEAAALLGIPLAFNAFLFYGFVNYVFAFPFLLFGLALAKRRLEVRVPPTATSQVRALIPEALIAVVIYYSHLQVFLVYVGGIGLLLLLHWPGLRSVGRRVLHLVPVGVLFLTWLALTDGLAGGEAWKRSVASRYETLTSAEWEPLWETINKASERLLSVYYDRSDELLTLALGFALLVVLLTRGLGDRDRRTSLFPELLTLCVFGFYVALPTSYKWIWPVSWRFLPLAVVLLCTWGSASLGRWARAGLAAAFGALALYAAGTHARHFREFAAEAGDFQAVLDATEPRKRLLTLCFDAGSAVVLGPAYLHFGQYYQIQKGGVATYSFSEAPQSPMRFKAFEEGGPPPTPLRSEWKAHEFRFPNGGRWYDYLLLRGEPPGFAHSAQLPRGEVALKLRVGKWSLYEHARGH